MLCSLKKWLFLLALMMAAGTNAAEPVVVLRRAHAHNDYEHSRPLTDALAQGFGSVEADVYLVNGELLVAHDRNSCSTNRTLQSLYLDPLRKRVEQLGGVYPGFLNFTLWIDIKIDSVKVKRESSTTDFEAKATCRAIADLLQRYESMLTRVSGESPTTNAINVVLTGSHPRTLPGRPGSAFLSLDSNDLSRPKGDNFTLAWNENWTHVFAWRGDGAIPEKERKALRELVQAAHRSGKRVRFWATPEKPAVWKELLEADVDWIGTDHLQELASFLKAQPKK